MVSFDALKQTLKKAGYTLASADITIIGRLMRENDKWVIVSEPSGQKFRLEGKTVDELLAKSELDSVVELTGNWKTLGEATATREIVEPQTVKKVDTKTVGTMIDATGSRKPDVKYISANFLSSSIPELPKLLNVAKGSLAPIRTTTPGLTVYQGGAITPRFYLIKQHLGELDVSRQILDISLSYTPTPKLQLEVEVPISRTTFDDGEISGSGVGLGNITLWSKYRFFRTVKTYGDRQAAVRFGLELPTGKKDAPNERAVNASAFVRQQLTPINGGLSPHIDVAFSQAGGRFIFGGNVEGIVRAERDGFRMGNELRVNTDFEYILFPFEYQKPGKELFLIFETNFITRGQGRFAEETVLGSKSTEFYLSPGLQYAADPRFVIEGSVQIPIFHNSGQQVLRTDLNLLLGVRYLF